MYLFDFFKRLARKANISVIIYLILNFAIITSFVYLLGGGERYLPFWLALIISIALYIGSMMIALSPLGEWILRLETGCKKIKRVEYINYIEPIFREVYEDAKKLDPSIPDDVQLFMNEDDDANAFATGRKTICITEGLLLVPEEQIKATLAHEFGHLAHKDTDLILVVSVGNLIINFFILCFRIAIDLVHLMFSIVAIFMGGEEGIAAQIGNIICHFAASLFVDGATWIWTTVGSLLVLKSSRSNEYEADEFAFNLGFGSELCDLLETIDGSKAQGLFATLASSHPNKNDRIARLQNLGATYRANFISGQAAHKDDMNAVEIMDTAHDEIADKTPETNNSEISARTPVEAPVRTPVEAPVRTPVEAPAEIPAEGRSLHRRMSPSPVSSLNSISTAAADASPAADQNADPGTTVHRRRRRPG